MNDESMPCRVSATPVQVSSCHERIMVGTFFSAACTAIAEHSSTMLMQKSDMCLIFFKLLCFTYKHNSPIYNWGCKFTTNFAYRQDVWSKSLLLSKNILLMGCIM